MNSIPKALIIIGLLFIGAGLLWHFSKGSISLGKLPGDIHIRSQNVEVFIPLTSSLVLGLILSLLFSLFHK